MINLKRLLLISILFVFSHIFGCSFYPVYIKYWNPNEYDFMGQKFRYLSNSNPTDDTTYLNLINGKYDGAYISTKKAMFYSANGYQKLPFQIMLIVNHRGNIYAQSWSYHSSEDVVVDKYGKEHNIFSGYWPDDLEDIARKPISLEEEQRALDEDRKKREAKMTREQIEFLNSQIMPEVAEYDGRKNPSYSHPDFTDVGWNQLQRMWVSGFSAHSTRHYDVSWAQTSKCLKIVDGISDEKVRQSFQYVKEYMETVNKKAGHYISQSARAKAAGGEILRRAIINGQIK